MTRPWDAGLPGVFLLSSTSFLPIFPGYAGLKSPGGPAGRAGGIIKMRIFFLYYCTAEDYNDSGTQQRPTPGEDDEGREVIIWKLGWVALQMRTAKNIIWHLPHQETACGPEAA
ncbi:hypothetical protein BDZ89DRAFT_1050879 [Hymenopellis radicata]|nr:hypothetical protein BDZ89DRAFT_1050879 [Hymenopellis radicata]